MLLHVMLVNMIDYERECMHEAEYKEGVCNPSVEDLKFLMRNPSDQYDPVRLYRCCAISGQRFKGFFKTN